MSPELARLLQMLAVLCLRRAERVPTPAEPPEPEWERETDEYCRRLARTQEAEEPSPEVAATLLPRLRYALVFGSPLQSALEAQGVSGESPEDERVLLEAVLVTLWHQHLRQRWLRGELE